ncbi:MAG: SpoIIIAC/SpoIIIAD family protein [Christensenellaceae bacterium]
MIKIVACAVLCAFVLIYLKSVNSEFFSVATLGVGVIIIALGIDYLTETVSFIQKIIDSSGINAKYFSVILKITGIAYIVEFGAGIVEDLGLKSVADKLVFIGKAAIFTAAIPIIYAVFELLIGLIQ